jgi:hypothetical protein
MREKRFDMLASEVEAVGLLQVKSQQAAGSYCY